MNGKVCVITGANAGIGFETAKALAKKGGTIGMVCRNKDKGKKALESIKASFPNANISLFIADMGSQQQIKDVAQKIGNQYEKVDVLVNNAAINPFYGPLEATGEEVFDKIMDVNVKAPWLLSNLVQPHMKENGGGSIINISSVEGVHPGFRLGLYSMSKSALIMLTKNQAKEWGKLGIRANVVCPGLIKTKFSQALWSDEKTLGMYTGTIPLRRMADPEEMAGLVMLLASDAGSYMTGGVYSADGGYLISG